MTSRAPDCPSDLELDRLETGELSPSRAAAVTAHVSACSLCAPRMADRADDRRVFDALPADLSRKIHRATAGRTPDAVESLVKQALGKPPPARRWPAWLTGWQLPTLGAVGLAAALVFRPRAPVEGPGEVAGNPGLPPETVTAKGGLGLTIHRKRGSTEEILVSGDTARAGDRIAFEADIPADGWALVLGVEASGKPYVAWPYDGTPTAAAVRGGDDQLWSGAAELDATVGKEWLALVWCDHPFGLSDVQWSVADARVAPTDGCRSTPFELQKTAP